jgi:hypothetical protein
MKETTVYVVGSQAIYGSFPDLDLGIVLASRGQGAWLRRRNLSDHPSAFALIGIV